MNYQAYLNSPEWEQVQERRLKLDGFQCTECSCTKELEAHHLTYERLGCEDIEDLRTLCVRCHNDKHYFAKREDATEDMILRITPVTEDEYFMKKAILLVQPFVHTQQANLKLHGATA